MSEGKPEHQQMTEMKTEEKSQGISCKRKKALTGL